jgi:type III secretory pathway component EscT
MSDEILPMQLKERVMGLLIGSLLPDPFYAIDLF